MKKKLSIIIGVLIVVSIFLFLYPYNLLHYVTADEKVRNVLAEPAVREEGMAGDYSEVTELQYLGSHHYFVKTEKVIML